MLIGRTLAINSNLSVQLALDLQPKVILGANGSTIGTGLKAIDHKLSQYNRFSLAGGLHLGLNYKLNNNYMLSWEMGYRMDITNQSAIDKFNQRFGLLGTELTLYYRIR
jgi:hypothetical protein